MGHLLFKTLFFVSAYFILGEKSVAANVQGFQNAYRNGGQLDDRELMLNLLNRVIQLESRDRQYQNTIQTLESTIRRQNRRISVLETAVSHVTSQRVKVVDEPKIDFHGNGFETKTEGFDTKQGLVNFDSENNNGTRQRRDKDVVRSRRQMISAVAFYASIDGHHLQNLGADQDIPFNKVYTNVGNAYHPVLGVFIAPEPGTYVFSATIMDVNQHDTRYYFSVNGNARGPLFIHGLSSYLGSISKSVTLLLKKGDEVSMRNANVGEGIYGYEYSSFTGFMLSFDDSPGVVVG